MRIKEILKKNKFIVRMYEAVWGRLNKYRENYLWRERKISWGEENADSIFYVIRRKPDADGLFAYVNTGLGLINYALKQGYIPVVDMQSTANTYLNSEFIGKENAWEYYFEQPKGYSIDDIKHSKNIILSGKETLKTCGYPGRSIVKDMKLRNMWKETANSYLKVNKNLSHQADQLYRDLTEGRKTLGVLCRGTDYVNLKPKNHPIQPDVNEMIDKVAEIYRKGCYEYIYLATEDEEVYRRFKEKFENRLRVTEAKRYSDTGMKKLATTEEFQKTDKRKNGEEYLINILLLTKCDGFVAGCTGGTYGALILRRDPYEDEYIFDLGTYK